MSVATQVTIEDLSSLPETDTLSSSVAATSASVINHDLSSPSSPSPLAKISQTINDELELWQKLDAELVLTAEDFNAGLTLLLDTLSDKRRLAYDQAVASLDKLADAASPEEIEDLKQKADKINSLRSQQLALVDNLLTELAAHKNWFHLLDAWEIFSQLQYLSIVNKYQYRHQLSQTALDFIDDKQKTSLVDSYRNGDSFDNCLRHLVQELEAEGLTLSKGQRQQFIAFLTPILQNFFSQQPSSSVDQTSSVKPTTTSKKKTSTPRKTSSSSIVKKSSSRSVSSADDTPKKSTTKDTEKLDKLVAQVKKNTDSLAKLQDSTNEVFAQLFQQIDSQTNDLTQKVAQDKKDLLGKNQDLCADLTHTANKVNTQLSQFDSSIKKCVQQVAQFEANANENSLQMQRLAEKLDQTQLQLATVEEKLTKHRQVQKTDEQSLQAQLQQLSEQLKQLTIAFNQQSATIVQKDTKLGSLSSQVSQLRDYASQLETENENLRLENAGLKQQNWQVQHASGSQTPSLTSAVVPTAPATIEPVNSTPISNLERLGFTKRHLSPQSPLLTGGSLSFQQLNHQLGQALIGKTLLVAASPAPAAQPKVTSPVIPVPEFPTEEAPAAVAPSNPAVSASSLPSIILPYT
ncbi:hypothetical protein IJJ27_03555 [bacterium]|nr:hypothetical protein [bacterium]